MASRITIRQAARLLDSGLITAEQLCKYCHTLAVAGEQIWKLSAFSTLTPLDDLLRQARESDQKRLHGEVSSIFEGIPVSIKANLAVSSQPLTAGSRMLGQGFTETPPVGYDADTVDVLVNEAGALLMGTTTMDEFGMGSLGSNVVSSDGISTTTKNPIPYLSQLHSNRLDWNDDAVVASHICKSSDEILEEHHMAYDESIQPLSAGGSSCGSAASVSHGSSLLSLGTDTGGSVRLPASWCQVVGLKPSYGLLSRHGVVSYASSFDTVGILAPSIECASIALDKLAQRGGVSRDSTASFYQDDQYTSINLNQFNSKDSAYLLEDIRLGIPSAFVVDEFPPGIKESLSQSAEHLQKHGASIESISSESISPDLVQKALAAYYVLVSAEASSNLSRYDGFRFGIAADKENIDPLKDQDLTPLERQFSAARMKGFGSEVVRRILCGTSVLSSDRFHTYYEAAAKLRTALSQQLKASLENQVDLLLIPTALSDPVVFDGNTPDSTEMFANDIMTVPASLAGLPAISVPVASSGGGTTTSNKVGLQLIGPRLREDLLFKVGQVLERY
jgi:aspartyl-tRNA(Asn)/glutamyl-tRNA(Gln) amidotransferase subunit A